MKNIYIALFVFAFASCNKSKNEVPSTRRTASSLSGITFTENQTIYYSNAATPITALSLDNTNADPNVVVSIVFTATKGYEINAVTYPFCAIVYPDGILKSTLSKTFLLDIVYVSKPYGYFLITARPRELL